MVDGDRLTLAEALRSDRLSEFVAEQEAGGLAAADRQRFERVVRAAVSRGTAEDRTSRSRSGDGSSGSRTRRGKAAVSRG
jgi:hypothetical protein